MRPFKTALSLALGVALCACSYLSSVPPSEAPLQATPLALDQACLIPQPSAGLPWTFHGSLHVTHPSACLLVVDPN